MSWTLTDIQTQIASEVDGNATINASGADWANRIAPINRANLDWASSYDWSSLKKIHNGKISTSTGNASYALPSDFVKLASTPIVAQFGNDLDKLPEVSAERNNLFTDSDYYVNILGNRSVGQTMYINAGTLSSGVSVQFVYYASPATLSSANQVIECPDPSYVVQRSLYYIYKSREDGRFPEAKVEADRIMARMLENENTVGRASDRAGVEVQPFNHFRLGRD